MLQLVTVKVFVAMQHDVTEYFMQDFTCQCEQIEERSSFCVHMHTHTHMYIYITHKCLTARAHVFLQSIIETHVVCHSKSVSLFTRGCKVQKSINSLRGSNLLFLWYVLRTDYYHDIVYCCDGNDLITNKYIAATNCRLQSSSDGQRMFLTS